MNCAGSERAENNKGFDCRNMGEVLGKECVKDEPSFARSSQEPLKEVGEGAASIAAACENESDKEVLADSDEDITWLLSFNADELNTNKCKCEGCLRRDETYTNEKKNAKLLLSSWKGFQSYIRKVYTNSPLESAQRTEVISLEEEERVHEMVLVMRLCDPYQLFQKIEDEVRAMVLQSRDRQLKLLKNEFSPSLAEEFIKGLFEEYFKLFSSTCQLSSPIQALLGRQFEMFGLTWELLNKHLFHSLVYSHNEVQENLPRFVSQLTVWPPKDVVNPELVYQYYVLEEEMDSVAYEWEKIEPVIQEYRKSKEREIETLNSLQEALKTFFANKHNAINGNGSIEGSSSPMSDKSQNCPNCLTRRGCPCDECTVTHMMSCEGLDSPPVPASPVSRSRSPVKEVECKDEVPGDEQQSCECHACTVFPPELMDCSVTFNQISGKNSHGEGFQLYPHIHGTVGENMYEPENVPGVYNNLQATPESVYPHLYNLHNQANSLANVPQATAPSAVPNRNKAVQSVTLEKVQSRPPVKPQQEKNKPITPAQLPTCPPPLPPPTPQEPSVPAKPVVQTKPIEKQVKPDVQKVVQPKPIPVSEINKPVEVKKPMNKVVAPKESEVKPPVEKPKILPNTKGGTCAKSRACGKCCVNCMKTPGCGKTPDKHLAAIARLGLATSTNPRGGLRCPPGKESEHTHKPGKGHSCGKLKPHDITKKAATARMNGHEPEDSSSQDDTCSERSNSTSASVQKDSRHCDCCYCEVFGHGVPSVAPVSRNYQEMRERLRLRLSMKKSAKCKAGQQGQQPGDKNATANSQDDGKKNPPKEKDLESLLKFIEGKSKDDSKDPKKLAKKARQKQKKLEEKERMEEEEADRKRLEAMKKQVSISVVNENNHKKSQQQQQNQQQQHQKQQQQQGKQNQSQSASKQQQSNSKNTNANINKNNNNNNNNRNNSNNQARNNQTLNLSGLKSLVEKSDPNSGPKMVTIRRVMAPFSAEPTVTITLKGSTPDKDKVLFMLKNGSETYQPEEKENTKKSKRKRKKGKKAAEYYEEDEPEEEYYEQEPEPIPEKTGRRRRRRNKNRGAEVEANVKPSRSTNQIESSKLKSTENLTGKNNKNKNSKNNSVGTNSSGSRAQDHGSGKNKSSTNVSVSVKSRSQNSSSTQVTNSKANSIKNVPVLKAQNQNVKIKEKANSKTSKNVGSTKNSNSNSNNCVSGKNVNSGKGGVRNISASVNVKAGKNQKQVVSNQKSAAVQIGKSQEKQSKTKKVEEMPQRQGQGKVKGSEPVKNKIVQKTGKNSGEKIQQRQDMKSMVQKQMQQQESLKKNKRTLMDSHQDLSSRFPMAGGYDRGKVVINTPSYRLSEVLSSIAPSPPPKEEINLENLRLPPGITITKIEGPITKSIRASEQPLHVSKPAPVTPPIVVSTPTLKQSHPPPPGNVIVVDTGRLKEVIKENAPGAVPAGATSKRKKKKNKQNAENSMPTMEVPMPQPYGLKLPKGNPMMGKSGVTVISADEARKMVPSLENQQATIIKTSDNMVTIRSPAFQQAMNMHAYQNSQSFRPGINGYNNVSLFREDVNRITDSIGKMKLSSDDKLARQMRNLNIKEGSRASQIFAQAMAAAGQNGQETGKKKKKKKRKGNRSDEKEVEPVESVFQPKDIDLENGDIDDDERELEAFKRFCFQSVPSERKNKVKVNLNIKDIVLKKKSSAIGCS